MYLPFLLAYRSAYRVQMILGYVNEQSCLDMAVCDYVFSVVVYTAQLFNLLLFLIFYLQGDD
jgi:hypothetical protein